MLAAAALPATRLDIVNAAPGAWEPLIVDGSGPPQRWDHSLIADPEEKRILLYGGRDGGGFAFGDTWIYDVAANAWSPVEVEAPAPRFGSAVAADPARRRGYLFGGQSDIFFNDTWRFSFTKMNWAQLDDGLAIAPSPRYGLPGVLAGENAFVISHGFTFEGRFNDTWSYDVTTKTWTDVSPGVDAVRPLNRCLHEMTWDSERSVMLLYGGCSSGFGPCPQGDSWEYDLSTSSWTEVTPATGPASRTNPAMVWDSATGGNYLIGGSTDAGVAADLWISDAGDAGFSWTDQSLADSPPPRSSHDAVILDGAIYLFGGNGVNGPMNDLWRLPLR